MPIIEHVFEERKSPHRYPGPVTFTEGISWTVAGLLLVVLVTGLSKRAGWSAPLVLVAVGIGVGFLPWTPRVVLSPEVVLTGVLPALLFAAALQTSFLEVRARGDSILTLSVGLVLFSVGAVGLVAWWLVPGIPIAAAFAFGAIVAPTDAVSVGALAGRMPRRLASLLEGEGLLNDATALVALNTAITAIGRPGFGALPALRDFGIAVVGGLVVGAVVAAVVVQVRRRLKAPVLDTSISLATPYVAYLPAVGIGALPGFAAGGSGFLAVVLTGIWLGYRAPSFQSAESRVAERLNWRTVSFLLENAVFLLIGLQLKSIVTAAARTDIGLLQGVLIIAGLYLAMVLARFAWVYGATVVYRVGPEALRERRWDWRTAFGISFAGVRGVVTLAAVFLLPPRTPLVGFLQLAAFVIVVLSLLQGLGIAPLVRLLRLPLPNPEQDRVQIRTLVAEAQTAALSRLEAEATEDDPLELVASLRQSAEYRVDIARTDEQGIAAQPDAYARLRLLMLDSERRAVLDARREGRYEESVVTAVLGDFDTIETALKRSRRRDLPKPQPKPPLALTRLRRRG